MKEGKEEKKIDKMGREDQKNKGKGKVRKVVGKDEKERREGNEYESRETAHDAGRGVECGTEGREEEWREGRQMKEEVEVKQ